MVILPHYEYVLDALIRKVLHFSSVIHDGPSVEVTYLHFNILHGVITGDSLRPDLLLKVYNKCLYILELSIGYETNLTRIIAHRDRKYQDLTRTLQ